MTLEWAHLKPQRLESIYILSTVCNESFHSKRPPVFLIEYNISHYNLPHVGHNKLVVISVWVNPSDFYEYIASILSWITSYPVLPSSSRFQSLCLFTRAAPTRSVTDQHSLPKCTAVVIEFCSSLDLFITLMLMLHDDVVSVNKWITEKIFNGCKTNKRSAKNLFKKSLETFAAHATSFPATHFSPVHGSSLRDKEEIQSVSSKQVLLSAISRSISRTDAENSFFSRR